MQEGPWRHHILDALVVYMVNFGDNINSGSSLIYLGKPHNISYEKNCGLIRISSGVNLWQRY